MHFRTLVTVDIPPVVEDEKENQAVVEAIAGLKSEKKPDKKNPNKTGDGAPILFMAFMVFAAGAVLVIYGKRARKR